MTGKHDRELGLDRPITRRDFIQGSALAMGGAIVGGSLPEQQPDYGFKLDVDWYGPGGIGDYAPSHGNTPELVGVAHEIRAGTFERPTLDAIDTGEVYDLAVIGAGFSGLSAAHHFRRLYPRGKTILLDNHPIFGGEAKRNEFEVEGVHLMGPQGSNDFAVQRETGEPDDYFTALNIPRDFEFREPEGAAEGMRIPFDNYDYAVWHSFDVGHFFRGADNPWVKDVWKTGLRSTPWRDEVQSAFRRLWETETPPEKRTDAWLDSMTLESYYTDVLKVPQDVSAYFDPIMASIVGLGCDSVSAYWGRVFALPGFTKPASYAADSDPLISFPGGNTAIARYFVKKLVPNAITGDTFSQTLFGNVAFDELDRESNSVRIRLRSTAVRVEHAGGDGVAVTYSRDGELYRLRAKSVVMASGGWVNRHVIRDLPQSHHDAYDEFTHAPQLVVNVALRNWRFLARLGVSATIWSGGFGFTCNIRRPMIIPGKTEPLHPDKPIVLTFYVPFVKPGIPMKQQGIVGRAEMLSTSFADYERQVREQMTVMFGEAGFDPATDIAGIILNRWGHAYVAPGPGFRFGMNDNPAPPDIIREPIGRIAIGHSELNGHQSWVGAAGEGRRAVEALLDAYF